MSAEGQRQFTFASGGRAVAGGSYRFLRADTRDATGASTILRGVHGAQAEQSVFGQIQQPWGKALKLVAAARFNSSQPAAASSGSVAEGRGHL